MSSDIDLEVIRNLCGEVAATASPECRKHLRSIVTVAEKMHAALRAERDAAVAALRLVEWIPDNATRSVFCPRCGVHVDGNKFASRPPADWHVDGCALAAALALYDQDLKGPSQ